MQGGALSPELLRGQLTAEDGHSVHRLEDDRGTIKMVVWKERVEHSGIACDQGRLTMSGWIGEGVPPTLSKLRLGVLMGCTTPLQHGPGDYV